MRKLITITILVLMTVFSLNAEEYYLRTFKSESLSTLNKPDADYNSEFRKDLSISDWSNIWTKVGSPKFQVYKTNDGSISYFYAACKSRDGEQLLVRVSYYISTEEKNDLIKGVVDLLDKTTK